MKKKKLYIIAALFLAGSLGSCSKAFLEVKPEDSIVDANFYQTSDQVLAGSAPLYNKVWFDYNDKASHGIGDARGGVLFSGSYQIDNIQMKTTSVTPEVAASWQSFFNVVAQSNSLILNVQKYAGASVPENVKQHAIAEARFMRGLAYSFLVENWGPVPIITDNSSSLLDTSIARNTVESVWQFILRDLRFASENLPASPVQKGRLTKWAAEGMLAKMYLVRSGVGQNGTRNQKDLDSAKILAQDVINNSGASLMQNYDDLFLMKNNNNQESLFALQWKYDGDWGCQNSVQAYLAFDPSVTGFADGWGGDIGASMYIMNMYENFDKRRKSTFMFPGDHYTTIHQGVPDPNDAKKTIEVLLDVPVRSKDENQVPYGARAWTKKYVVGRPSDNDGKVLQQRTEINTYLLRLADVYLVYAEAILGNSNSTNDATALQFFNAVHQRAGLDPKTAITADDIFKERFLEFAMEGQAWYQIVQLHYYNPSKALQILNEQDRGSYKIYPNELTNASSWKIQSDQKATYPVSEANFYLPIPSTEMTMAPNLAKPPVPYQF